MNIYNSLPKPFFVLAPMDDVTDTAFRQIIASLASPDLFFTEFVNVDGLQSPGRPKLIHKLDFTIKETPLIAQIWGKRPENYYKTAKELVEMGFAGVDINMGCPDKAVVKNGCCVALINDRPLAKEIIEATKKGVEGKLPISVKTRLGFNEVNLSWHRFLLEQDLDALYVHGRTKKELSNVPANWELIGDIRAIRDELGVDTKVIGNGDVMTTEAGLELARKHKLDGVMVGRGVFSDPILFSGDPKKWLAYTPKQKKDLFAEHIKLFVKANPDITSRISPLKKFAKLYISNFDGAKELREQLMLANSAETLLELLD